MITVVGEALVDVIIREDAAAPALHPGGSAANVAVALSRLGQPATLLTQLGADDYGDLLRAHLERNGVPVVAAAPATAPTSRAIARLDGTGAASYQFELAWDVRDLRLAAGSRALHVGSLGVVLAPGDEQVRMLADQASRRPDVLVSYDPNIRPSLSPDRPQAAEIARWLAARADVVKMSDEDLAFLFPGTGPEEIARRLLDPAAGLTKLLVVTLGAGGAVAATAGGCWPVPGFAVQVADTVGAGDTFTAALLAGLAEAGLLSPPALAAGAAPGPLDHIVRQAMAAAALTCTRPGADPPTARELRGFCPASARPGPALPAHRSR